MSEDMTVTQVKSKSIGQPGRSINTARSQNFVIDSPTLGESLGSAEAFLAGVSSCGVNLIEVQAQKSGVPLTAIEVGIQGYRAKEGPAIFKKVDMRFELSGVSQEQAEQLVTIYQTN